MITMNKRTLLEFSPQSVGNFISDWQPRVMVLLSLYCQIALVLLGSRRKYTSGKLLSYFVWTVHSTTNWVSLIYVGVLSNCQGYEDKSSQQKNMSHVFWALFMLLHFGGADTITAYSLEDNKLWTRHLLGLVTRFAMTSSIFIRSWKATPLNFVAIPMLVAGVNKSVEKTMILRYRSDYYSRTHPDPPKDPDLPEDPDPGNVTHCPGNGKHCSGNDGDRCIDECDCKSCPGNGNHCSGNGGDRCIDECECKRAQGCCVSLQPIIENFEVLNIIPSPAPRNKSITDADLLQRAEVLNIIPSPAPRNKSILDAGKTDADLLQRAEMLNIIPSPAPRNKSIPDADLLQWANKFFANFKRLFTGLNLEPKDLKESKFFFKDKSWTEAFKVIEIELGLEYDMLYTKTMVAYPKWGGLRRFIPLCFIILTFMPFLIIDKREFSTIEVIITFLLLVGAIVLEIYSIILMFSSDWTKIWLSKQEKTLLYCICQAISSCRVPFLFPANKRWSDSMAKYSLISDSLKKLPTKFSEVWKFFCICQKLEDLSSKNSNVVPKYLKRLIFEQLKEKSAILWQSDKLDIEAAKKFCARRGDWTLEKTNCFPRLGWSTTGAFDKSILLWHIATDLCYYTDLNKNSSPVKNSNCKSSKLLSDYMVHLLVMRPLMLPEGIGQIRFQDSYAEATEVFQRGKNVKDRIQACKKLLRVNTEIPPSKVKGDGSKSVLFDACRLAKSLQSLETEEEWECERKWEMMSHVWVELLCYAACHCPRDDHAKGLTLGGELLTHVWLLMAHFGITEHICQG